MRIVLNGDDRDVPETATALVAVELSGAPEPHSGVAVAVDGEVVPRGSWDSTPLAEGQRVEVLQAVQGG